MKIIQSAGLSCFVVVSLHCVGIFSSVSLLLFLGGGLSYQRKEDSCFFFRFFSSRLFSGHKKKRELSEITPLI